MNTIHLNYIFILRINISSIGHTNVMLCALCKYIVLYRRRNNCIGRYFGVVDVDPIALAPNSYENWFTLKHIWWNCIVLMSKSRQKMYVLNSYVSLICNICNELKQSFGNNNIIFENDWNGIKCIVSVCLYERECRLS